MRETMETKGKKEEIKKALECFVIENKDLELLEDKLASFNLFEAIGMYGQEIRHSTTLAFFLDPSKGHGLGQYFLKKVLKGFASSAKGKVEISPIDIDCADLADVEVRREWENIDLLLISNENKLVIAVENKIFSREHGSQLKTYRSKIHKQADWSGYKKIFIFLTIDGDVPSYKEEEKYWASYTHENVVNFLEVSLKAKFNELATDQSVLIRHYIELMRRHVLPKSEIAELAQKIYANHKHALDIIFKHIPDQHLVFGNHIENKVSQTQGLLNCVSSKRYKRFKDNTWTFCDELCENSTAFSDCGVAFEFDVQKNLSNVGLKIVVGNPPNSKKRNLLRDAITKQTSYECSPTSEYPRVWSSKNPLKFTVHQKGDIEAMCDAFDIWWDKFLANDRDRLVKFVNDALDEINGRPKEECS